MSERKSNTQQQQFGRELWLACYLYATNPFYIDVDTSGMDEKRLIEEWNKHYSEYLSEQHFGYDKGVNSEEYGITRNQ